MNRDESLERLTAFAVGIIRMARSLSRDTAGWTLGRQVIRSGTSIVGNVEEAFGTATRRDFHNKYVIARKEARETRRWPIILERAGLASKQQIAPLLSESDEIVAMLTTSVKTI